jgi:hypothetical protein
MTGEAFREMAGPYSVAIDGYVSEGPWYDDKLPCQNFNHHEGVPRLETRATCAQVLVAIRQGFFRRYRDENGPRAVVYTNDCDEDVCLSWYLLKNNVLAAQTLNPPLNRLVHMVDMMDTTCGAYPFPEDLPSLRALTWVFEPYRRFRFSGGLARRDADEFESIVTDVEHRISAHTSGTGREATIDTRYVILGNHVGWTHVREIGTQARIGMFSDGIRAFVSSTPYGDGRWMHIIGRMSAYEQYPVPKILDAMNKAEGITGANRWGGGQTIGGAPRIGGSALDPKQVAEIIEDVVKAG